MQEEKNQRDPIPGWVLNGKLFLPENSETYKRTPQEYRVRIFDANRREEIERAKTQPVPSITAADSWSNCVDWRTSNKILEFLNKLALKSDITNRKAFILSGGIKGRIRWNEEDDSWYGWVGNAWNPFDSGKGEEKLYRIFSNGMSVFFSFQRTIFAGD